MKLETTVLLICLIQSIYSKCGLNKNCGKSYCHFDKSCNDVESFELCKTAETLVNNYVELVVETTENATLYTKFEPGCEQYIECSCDEPEDFYGDVLYCQSSILYDLCLNAITFIQDYEIELDKSNITLHEHVTVQRPIITCTKYSGKDKCVDYDTKSDGSRLVPGLVVLGLVYALL